jgi:hypothetical protein
MDDILFRPSPFEAPFPSAGSDEEPSADLAGASPDQAQPHTMAPDVAWPDLAAFLPRLDAVEPGPAAMAAAAQHLAASADPASAFAILPASLRARLAESPDGLRWLAALFERAGRKCPQPQGRVSVATPPPSKQPAGTRKTSGPDFSSEHGLSEPVLPGPDVIGQSMSGQRPSGRGRSEQRRSGENRPGESRPGENRSGHGQGGSGRPFAGTAEATRAERRASPDCGLSDALASGEARTCRPAGETPSRQRLDAQAPDGERAPALRPGLLWAERVLQAILARAPEDAEAWARYDAFLARDSQPRKRAALATLTAPARATGAERPAAIEPGDPSCAEAPGSPFGRGEPARGPQAGTNMPDFPASAADMPGHATPAARARQQAASPAPYKPLLPALPVAAPAGASRDRAGNNGL